VARRGKGSPSQASDRLISGRLRGKAAREGALAAIITVDGIDYAWAYRHGWIVWGKGIKAISLSASLRPERTRELILDFTLKVTDGDGPPSETSLLRALEYGIRSALGAGWDPESRGRAFRHELANTISGR
jgi:hypothetical protein